MTPDAAPIFIGGLSHSGKTPLRIVLSAHPDLALFRKTYLWERYYGRFGDLADPRALDRCLRELSRDGRVHPLGLDIAAVRREFTAGPRSYARLFGAVHGQAAARQGRRRWGEQLGLIERYADPIFADFPEARMIHLLRDPRSRLAEVLDGHRPGPGRRGWESAKWQRSAELATRNELRHGKRYRVVRYEALVHDPEATVRALCEFVGEDYVDPVADAARGLVDRGTTASLPGPNPTLDRRDATDRMGANAWQFLERRRSSRVGA